MDNLSDKEWDNICWRREFFNCTDQFERRALRKDVFLNTVEIVNRGFYDINYGLIEMKELNPSSTIFYEKPEHIVDGELFETQILVVNADCLETAQILFKSGFNPLVLNMASRQNPGGAVLSGSGAQEENLFRRTNLFKSLYRFVDYGDKYDVMRDGQHSYPMDRNTGGIYSGYICVFRSAESGGYALLKKPYRVSVVTVAAINNPELVEHDGEYRIAGHLVEPEKEKIRTILRIALLNNHHEIVLSAFGCGAYCTPPKHMAELFDEVFNESEFKNKFNIIIFAIIDDHNSGKEHNPDGNLIPFAEVFS